MCLLGLLVASLAVIAYYHYVARRLETTPPLWSMTRFPPPSVAPDRFSVKASFAVGVIALTGSILWLFVWVVCWVAMRPYGLFMLSLFIGLIQPSFLFAVCIGLWAFMLVTFPWNTKHRRGITFAAHSDHFRGTMRPVAKKAWVIGQSVIPWSAVESYSWRPDHLELTVRPGRPHNRISEKWLVSGVVPPKQWQTAHEFLSARIPGEGEPTSDSVKDQTAPDESPS